MTLLQFPINLLPGVIPEKGQGWNVDSRREGFGVSLKSIYAIPVCGRGLHVGNNQFA